MAGSLETTPVAACRVIDRKILRRAWF